MRVLDMYLDYVNNFLLIDHFAEHYGITVDRAVRVIRVGRHLSNKPPQFKKLRWDEETPERMMIVGGEIQMIDGSDVREYLKSFMEAFGIPDKMPVSLMTTCTSENMRSEIMFWRAAGGLG